MEVPDAGTAVPSPRHGHGHRHGCDPYRLHSTSRCALHRQDAAPTKAACIVESKARHSVRHVGRGLLLTLQINHGGSDDGRTSR